MKNVWSTETAIQLLQDPIKLLANNMLKVWVDKHGGLESVLQLIRSLPLQNKLLKLRDTLLNNPGETIEYYSNELNIHFTTFHKHRRLLGEQISTALNAMKTDDTPFPIGREEECREIQHLFHQNERLITIHGTGGVGKTFIAQFMATSISSLGIEQSFFIDLSAVNDYKLVPYVIAQKIGLDLADQSIEESLQIKLKRSNYLLILDNFEQVFYARKLVYHLIKSTSNLKILVTSRRILNIEFENSIAINPLKYPAIGYPLDIHNYASFSSMVLFENLSKVSVDEATLGTIANICYQLDGLPLAIRLVIPRLKYLSLSDVLLALSNDRNISKLESLDKDEGRHKDVYNTIKWSFNLLERHEQNLFRCCGVFPSSFTIPQLMSLFDSKFESQGHEKFMGLIQQLIDNNLITRIDCLETRYTMLKLIRDFAVLQVEADVMQDLKKEHALLIYNAIKKGTISEYDDDNIDVALEWMINHEASNALDMCRILQDFWYDRNKFFQALKYVQSLRLLLNHSNIQDQADILYLEGFFTFELGDFLTAASLLYQAEALERRPFQRALILNKLGQSLSLNAEYEKAKDYIQETLNIYETIGQSVPLRNKALAFADLGVVLGNLEQTDEAIKHLETGLAIYKMIGDVGQVSMVYSYLGRIFYAIGKKTNAMAAYTDALRVQEGIARPYRRATLFSHLGLGIADLFTQEFTSATHHFQIALRESLDINHAGGLIWSVMEFGLLAGFQGRMDLAAQFLSWSERSREETGNRFAPAFERGYQFVLAGFKANIDNDLLWNTLWESGRQMTKEMVLQVISDTYGEY